MHWKRLIRLLVLIEVLGAAAVAQKPGKSYQQEQTVFDSDAGSAEEFTRKPVEIAPAALQLLRDTFPPGTSDGIQDKGTRLDQVPAPWFVASEIHLDGSNEVDLVVRPDVLKLGTHGLPHSEASVCMLGAAVIPFWVLRNVGGRYLLLLETDAVELDVLDSRT